MSERQVEEEQVRQALLVKRARFARVLELHHGQGLSTFCVAAELKMSEEEVCAILEEAERGR
jgi:DNA-binding transcriptional regulator LsrR (DeoR family)